MKTSTDLTFDAVIIKLPFDGCAQTFIRAGKIAYSHFTTFEEYNEAKGGNMKLISWDEFNKMRQDFYHIPFSEITEDQYDEVLNCLPPMEWHDLNTRFNIFFCSEAMSGEFHGAYVLDRQNHKYYSAQINVFTSDEDILKMLAHL